VVLMFWLSLAAVVRKLWSASAAQLRIANGPPAIVDPQSSLLYPRPSILVFLLLWLALEIGCYFALSPFPAARRVLGVVVVATVLAGRLAAATPFTTRRPALIANAVGAVCGALVTVVDFQEALATHQAAEKTAAVVHGKRDGGTAWYSGTWGICY